MTVVWHKHHITSINFIDSLALRSCKECMPYKLGYNKILTLITEVSSLSSPINL